MHLRVWLVPRVSETELLVRIPGLYWGDPLKRTGSLKSDLIERV